MSVKHVDIKEFRELGWVQEINRRLLHPGGFALEVTIVPEDGWDPESPTVRKYAEALVEGCQSWKDQVEFAVAMLNELHPPGSEFISGVWDCRDDPEGVYFGDDDTTGKALSVQRELAARFNQRVAGLGFFVEPTGDPFIDEGDL